MTLSYRVSYTHLVCADELLTCSDEELWIFFWRGVAVEGTAGTSAQSVKSKETPDVQTACVTEYEQIMQITGMQIYGSHVR